ncbi:MAG: hypothetical protein WD873_06275 [Candidatus Hydrogenedentales bacterium]
MTTQRLFVLLTVINLGLFAFQVSPVSSANAATDDVIRGSGIEIVDENGRLRAQLKLEPANPDFKMPDGTQGYPDTVIFRLITPDGKPRVKLTTSEEGSGLMLLGDSDDTQSVLFADGKESRLKLRNTEADQTLVKP